jgi:hypothetical protein
MRLLTRLALAAMLLLHSIPSALRAAERKVSPMEQFLVKAGYTPAHFAFEGDVLFATGRFGDKRVRYSIDLSSPLTLVSLRYARLLAPPPQSATNPAVAGALQIQALLELKTAPTMELAGFPVDGHLVRPTDLKVLASGHKTGSLSEHIAFNLDAPKDVDVILGLDFVRRVHGLFDCGEGVLYLRRQPSSEKVDDIVVRSFELSGLSQVTLKGSPVQPLIEIRIGGEPTDFPIGRNAGSRMESALAKRLGLQPLTIDNVVLLGTKGRERRASTVVVPDVQVGEARIDSLQFVAVPTDFLGDAATARERFLGFDVLSKVHALVEPERMRMFVVRTKSKTP